MDNFKVTDVQHAMMINSLKNAKQQLFETNAAIWFSKICGISQLAH